MLVFRQLFDPPSSTYTYLLGCSVTREAVLIDPVFEQVRRDAALIGELGLQAAVDARHPCPCRPCDRRLAPEAEAGQPDRAVGGGRRQGADRQLSDGDRVEFGRRSLEVRATPGHTDGCVTYVLDDESMAFTGDCLLIRGSGRTDFQQGDPRALYRSVRSRIFSLPETCLLYPAHDYRGLTATSVAEEKQFNPRLGGEVGEGDFVGYMKNLGLPHPEDDRRGGAGQPALRPARQRDRARRPIPSWAPLRCTFGGVWEVEPHWLEENLATGAGARRARARRVQRPARPHRRCDADAAGRTRRARQGAAQGQADRRGLPRRQPLGPGHRDPAEGGLRDIANLPGGMLRWRAEGRAVEGGAV